MENFIFYAVTECSDPNLVESNFLGKPLITYLGWSAEMLVANIVEPMKWSDSKQLAVYTLAQCIALVPSLPLLTAY